MTGTSLALLKTDDVVIRGESLCQDLIGTASFTEMAYFLITGRKPTPAQTVVVDACLVSLMEHGLTPSALVSRLTHAGAPDALQGAVAAGLLGVGSVYAGTMEGCAALLTEIAREGEARARVVAQRHRDERRPVPGFGHPTHKPEDPRAQRILHVLREQEVWGCHADALIALSTAVDELRGRHLTINATGAIAAALADSEIPASVLRGFALISRTAGLVAHLLEEQYEPAAQAIWDAAEGAIPYVGPQPGNTPEGAEQ